MFLSEWRFSLSECHWPPGTGGNQTATEGKKKQQQRLRRQQREAGLIPRCAPTPSNCKSRFESTEQETSARHDAVTGLIQLVRQQLPVLLKRLDKIPDSRNPNKLKYKITVLMIYGILVFVFQYASRRAANGEITRPMFEENLRVLLPVLCLCP